MKEHLNSYCKGCDQFSAPHRRRDDGQWVCEDCGHLVECSDPQWSDNCDGDLTTPYEVKKGLCEGCMAVIDSWSEDGDADDGAEQTKLVTDGGERLRDDVEHAPDRPYGTAQARKVNRNALRASLHERGFIGVDLTMHNRDYALVDLSGVPEPRQEVAEVYFESWEAAFRERDVQGFGWGVRI
jgi:hypothetical protein